MYVRLSWTVRLWCRRSSWLTKAILRFTALFIFAPSKRIEPLTLTLRLLRPPMISRRVLFPDPLGPISATTSPGLTRPFTSCKICRSLAGRPGRS